MYYKKLIKRWLYIIAAIYTVSVLIMLLRIDRLFDAGYEAYRNVNLIPFNTISNFVQGNYTLYRAAGNIIGNIAIFVPIGVYLESFKYQAEKNIIYIMLFSSAVEFLQYLLGTGACDIDDIILNTIGGFFGICFFRLLAKFFTYQKSVLYIVIISSLCMAAMIILILMLFLAN